MRIVRTLTLIVCSLFISSMIISPRTTRADDCGAKDLFEKYEHIYDSCDEALREADIVREDCFSYLGKEGRSYMIRLLMSCGRYDLALPYLEKHRQDPYKGYNSSFYLEALHLDDEDTMITQGLLYGVAYSGADAQRFLANSYARYGDFDNAEEILERALEKNPDNLRVAHTLTNVNIYQGDFDNAEYYAEYYLEGDKDWTGVYDNLATIYYYRGDYDKSWEYLNSGGASRRYSGYGSSFLFGRYYVTMGEFEKALDSFKQVRTRYPYIQTVRFHKREYNFSDFYIDLYETEGSIPGVDVLEARTDDYFEKGDYFTAGMYYQLLGMIDPENTSYFRDFAYMMELHGDMYLATIFYSLYLALEPDAEDLADIRAFMDSRRYAPPQMPCSDYEAGDCEGDERCYWNSGRDACTPRSIPCNGYPNMDTCNSTPVKTGCYWNSSLGCVSINSSCYSYKSEVACLDTPSNKRCEWMDSHQICRERF